MNRTIRLIGSLFAWGIVISLTACGESEPAKPRAAPSPPTETVFDDLISTQQRAKQTEQTLKQGKKNVDAAVKQAEDPSSAQQH